MIPRIAFDGGKYMLEALDTYIEHCIVQEIGEQLRVARFLSLGGVTFDLPLCELLALSMAHRPGFSKLSSS